MLYLEYERLKSKYKNSQIVYDSILTEKEELFQRTQPQGINTKKEKVSSCPQGTNFDQYLIEKERKGIDERLIEAKENFEERLILLVRKETELRASKRVDDMIYTLRHLDRLKIRKIAKMTNYSESHIKRRLKVIRQKIKDDTF